MAARKFRCGQAGPRLIKRHRNRRQSWNRSKIKPHHESHEGHGGFVEYYTECLTFVLFATFVVREILPLGVRKNFGACENSQRKRGDMEIPQIQIHDAKQRLDDAACLFVDVRDPRSYRTAHIPGAVHLHDGNIREFLQNKEKGQAIVVYCYHGNSSLGAAAFLLENGFKNVASMSGGFEAWRGTYEHETQE